ncbi:MAG: PD-(D/E)XK nuclease family protein, partial [Bacteroidaceae bacterium]|nr:PD-(D/E)XK nuclease family protein [Bacteroidaceae bacterium]
DYQHAPFQYFGSEVKLYTPYSFTSGGNDIKVKLGGTIDRVDCKQERIDIIDYKTGGWNEDDCKMTLDDVFSHKENSAKYHLQSFLYSVVLKKQLSGKCKCESEWLKKITYPETKKIAPLLLYVHLKDNAVRDEFIVNHNKKPVNDITEIETAFMSKLQDVLSEIFDIDKPFVPVADVDKCKYCDYKEICGR